MYGDTRRYPKNPALELAMKTAIPLFVGVGTLGLVSPSLSAKVTGVMFLGLGALGPFVAARAKHSPPYNVETINKAMMARAKNR